MVMRRLLALIFVMSSLVSNGQELELTWDFLHPVKKEWMSLGKKGSVQEALMASGELPDPFYGENELKFNWLEEHIWEFKSILFVDSAMLNKEFVELVFPSIDTYADIYINDSLVDSTANAFMPHYFNVKNFLREGANEINVVITPPVIYHKDRWETEGYHLPAPNDVHDIAIAPYTRKPQYQFGWDWSLRMNTIGFHKPAKLVGHDQGRLIWKTVRVMDVFEDKANVQFDVYLSDFEKDRDLIWSSKLFGDLPLDGGYGRYVTEYTIRDVKLWWPRGYGDPNLYEDHVVIKTAENQVIVEFDLKFGVKTSELVQEEDVWGTSYYFKINGERVFSKGANYIPQDVFPARVKDEDIVEMVETMAESNFNMVRVWGGGYYPDEIFYEKCDELGLMVWQDLMFACAMYPGWFEFIENVAYELEYQVPRIAGHPSVVQFNGNNEVEVAWGNWGFQIKYGLYGNSAREIEKAYDDIFKVTAKNIVAESVTPYIHTSPLSNWGRNELYNHGSQHYWGVWHGSDPLEDFGKKIGRFNAEYGFQSFPEFNTLRSFSTEDEWDISSDVMKHHQKSYVGNNMILKHAKRLYGNPETFEEFVYYSQLTQATAVSMAIAGHRIDAPRCGGTLVWQLNDCWPVSSWSSVDYYGNWKALQYRMRDDYKDVAVLAKYNNLKDVEYYIKTDLPGEHKIELHYEIYDLKGKKIGSGSEVHMMTKEQSQRIVIDFDNKRKSKKDRHIIFHWKVDGGEVNNRSFDEMRSKRGYEEACEDKVEFKLTDVDEKEKTAVLVINNDRFLRDLWITSKEFGVKYDRNFISLLPGQHEFKFSFDKLPVKSDFKLFWN
jgi:beta-mannosidase